MTVTLVVVCAAIVDVYFGVIRSSDTDEGVDTLPPEDDTLSLYPTTASDPTSAMSSSTELPTETVTDGTTTSIEAPGEAETLYNYVWQHGEDGVISSDDWTASPQTLLADCMEMCHSVQKTSGNYFDETGAVQGWPDENCFCTSSIFCFSTVLASEIDRIKTGSSFVNVNKNAYDTCDDSYCVSWPYMCS